MIDVQRVKLAGISLRQFSRYVGRYVTGNAERSKGRERAGSPRPAQTIPAVPPAGAGQPRFHYDPDARDVKKLI